MGISKTINKAPVLAIVVPCFNESNIITKTCYCLLNVLDELIVKKNIDSKSFLLFVDDGSHDNTWEVIFKQQQQNKQIKTLKLSQNVGQQKALLAGLTSIKEKVDCALTMDADLQDDPGAMPQFVDQFLAGHDVVFGIRTKRQTDSFFKRQSANFYYRLLGLSNKKIIPNHAEYRLISVEILKKLPYYKCDNIFLRGLLPQLAKNPAYVHYLRRARIGGKSKYSWWKMMRLGWQGLRFSYKQRCHLNISMSYQDEKSDPDLSGSSRTDYDPGSS